MTTLAVFLLITLSIVMFTGGFILGLLLGWERGWNDCEEVSHEE